MRFSWPLLPHTSGAAFRALTRYATVVTLVGMLTLVGAPSAAAADDQDRVGHPVRDYMGATIPGHAGLRSGQAPAGDSPPGQPGIDVSRYQDGIDWSQVADDGIRFAYIKATEGSSYTDPAFAANYAGSGDAGLVRGAYHFALPDHSSAAIQARFFLTHGGGWPTEGQTLPPVLDIEYNPYGPDCYGLSQRQMIAWIASFNATVKHSTGRDPVIYTTTDWWGKCTGNYGGFTDTNRIWVANWGPDPSPLPPGWDRYTFWQYTSKGRVSGIDGPVDRDTFNGSYPQLDRLAG